MPGTACMHAARAVRPLPGVDHDSILRNPNPSDRPDPDSLVRHPGCGWCPVRVVDDGEAGASARPRSRSAIGLRPVGARRRIDRGAPDARAALPSRGAGAERTAAAFQALGWALVHGRLTNVALAVAFPGGPRHDLGLYDAMLLGAISAVLFAVARRELLQDRLLALLALLYGVGRFALDFLRAADVPYSDARDFGLTPAQYVCILLVAYGAIRLALRREPSLKAASGAGDTAGARSLPATHFEQGV